MLDHSTPYCNANFTGMKEEEPPLFLAMRDFISHGMEEDWASCAAKVILLLRRGADVNKRGFLESLPPEEFHTCISYALSSNGPSNGRRERRDMKSESIRGSAVKDLLTILVTAGADVNAEISYDGWSSCSALVAQHPKRKALWSKVLRTCGYDPEAVFSGRKVPRTATLSFEEYCRTRVPIKYRPRVEELNADDDVGSDNGNFGEDFWPASDDDVDGGMSEISGLNQALGGLNQDSDMPVVLGWDSETEISANFGDNTMDFQLSDAIYLS